MCSEHTAPASEGASPIPQQSKGRGGALGTLDRFLKLHRLNSGLKEEFSHIFMKLKHRIIETLRLVKTPKIIKSSHQTKVPGFQRMYYA